jgi:phage terminase large subunit GpA-like protein
LEARAESLSDHEKLQRAFSNIRRSILKPVPRLALDEWADKYRFLSPESSSEAGRWDTSRVEVARGPMRAITDPSVHTVTVMCATQILKSELLLNTVGYHIHQDPAPMLIVQPTDLLAEGFSKDRIDKLVRDTSVLRERVSEKKSRDSANSILHKQFNGGHLTIVGSNSPANLAMRPIRILLCDEIDKYPQSAGQEGDPIMLAKERTSTFWNRKIVQVCSPTVEGRSRVAIEYEDSDQRVFMVPCPHCEYSHELQWVNVKWPKDKPKEALYHCPECEKPWLEYQRLQAVTKGYWEATKPFNGHAGFRCSALVSPWETIAEIALKFVRAQKKGPESLKVFINTKLAETFKEKGEAPEWERLYERRETYAIGTVPDRACFLTAGVDVQKDRIEVQVVAFGRGQESWSVDYRVIHGDTLLDETWAKLTAMVNETWEHESGSMLPIRMMCVDTGYNTQKVYGWVRNQPRTKVIAIKGRDSLQMAIGKPSDVDVNVHGRMMKRGLKLWPVGVSLIKGELYNRLSLPKPTEGNEYPPGYMHYPQYDEEFFKQLTAENLTTRVSKGYRKYEWQKHRDRNEALDTAVYCRAAASAVGIDRMKDADWKRIENEVGVGVKKESTELAAAIPKPVIAPENKRFKRPEKQWLKGE